MSETVRWLVWDSNDFILRTCETQLEAEEWADEFGGFVKGPYKLEGEHIYFENSERN